MTDQIDRGTYMSPRRGGGPRPTQPGGRRGVVGHIANPEDRTDQYKKTYEVVNEYIHVKMLIRGIKGPAADMRDFAGYYDIRIYEIRKGGWLSKIAAAEWGMASWWTRLQALTDTQEDALIRGVIMDLVPGHTRPDMIYPGERVFAIFRNNENRPLDLAKEQNRFRTEEQEWERKRKGVVEKNKRRMGVAGKADIKTDFMIGAIEILKEAKYRSKPCAKETREVLQALLDKGDDLYIREHVWLRRKWEELIARWRSGRGPRPRKEMLHRMLMGNLKRVTGHMRDDVTRLVAKSIKDPKAGVCTREEVESFAEAMRKHIRTSIGLYNLIQKGGWSTEAKEFEMHFSVLHGYAREHYDKHPKSVVRGMINFKSQQSPL